MSRQIPRVSIQRVARQWLRAQVSPRIQEAIEESMANLPEAVQREMWHFSQMVPVGRAPDLEKYTAVMYKAFAPLRRVLGSVTMYRGEPLDPPRIKRKWLSWTTSPSLASQFAGVREHHIVEAKVEVSDVVAAIVSPHNDRYIEYLVLDRPEYHQPSKDQVPLYYSTSLVEDYATAWPEHLDPWADTPEVHAARFPGWERWVEGVRRAVERVGGKVLKVREPDHDHNPLVSFLLSSGQEPPVEVDGDGVPMPMYLGRL
jgi:hypothetical protein